MIDDVGWNADLGDEPDAGSRASGRAARGPGKASGGAPPPSARALPAQRHEEPDDAAFAADEVAVGSRKRSAWRWTRRRAANRERPPWWAVPPDGYLNVEGRTGTTRPRALRALARTAAKVGLPDRAGQPLPVQRYVEAQEQARLALHARRELPRVTAVASQIMAVNSRLADAEEQHRQVVRHRLATVAAHPVGAAAPGPAAGGAGIADDPAGHRVPPVIGPWTETAILTLVTGGEAVLAYAATRGLGLPALPLGLLIVAMAVGLTTTARLVAVGIDRLGTAADEAEHRARRRWVDVAVAGGTLVSGVTLAFAMGRLTSAPRAGQGVAPAGAGTGSADCADCATLVDWQVIVLGLALFGLATAVSYAAIPYRGGAGASRWRSAAARLRHLLEAHSRRRQTRAAQRQQALARAAVRQLREELAVLVPQLLAAEQSALLFWRYQIALGDGAQYALAQHLAAFTTRRSRGMWRPILDWWQGAAPGVLETGTDFPSIGETQQDWEGQVVQITMAAKRLLVQRGLLDSGDGLPLPRPPQAPPPARPDGDRGLSQA